MESNPAAAEDVLAPWLNYQVQMDAMKNFLLTLEGPDELTY
jgi:hypothetical protein